MLRFLFETIMLSEFRVNVKVKQTMEIRVDRIVNVLGWLFLIIERSFVS